MPPFDSNGDTDDPPSIGSGSGGPAHGRVGPLLFHADGIRTGGSLLLRLSLLHQLRKVVLPHRSRGMGAVTARLIADRKQNEPAMRNPLHRLLRNPKLRRIDIVV